MRKAAKSGKGEWDLSELVSGEKGFNEVSARLESLTNEFEGVRKDLNGAISSTRFKEIIRALELLNETAYRMGSYASLRFSEDTQSEGNAALRLKAERAMSDVSGRISFFNIWWEKDLDEANARRLLRTAGDITYFLEYARRLARYTLTEPEEKIIAKLSPTGISALVNVYDKITNAFEYEMRVKGRNETLNREQLSELFRSPNARERELAYRVLLEKYARNLPVLGDIYQSRVLNWSDECVSIRKYASPLSARNVSNDMEDGAVDMLLDSCRRNAKTFKEYFTLKASASGAERLRRCDLYMPMSSGDKRKYSYQEATRAVLDAWKGFSPRLAGHMAATFARNHVDYGVRTGKRSGAFCAGVLPSILPYVQLTFNGTLENVFTLAHEMGHAAHHAAASDHSVLNIGAPLTLCETASTFSESLLFDSIADRLEGAERRDLLFGRFDDFYSTIGRQAFFTIFEKQAHERIAGGATTEEVSKEYRRTLNEQFSGSVDVPKEFDHEWAAIPHIYHTPFYCYAYAFGNLLALAMFQRYKEEGTAFARDYEAILAAGGSQNPQKLLDEHGISISTAETWDAGFDYLREQLRMLRQQ